MEKNKKLSAREALFCQNYVRTGSPREAAARSGYLVFPEKNGVRLIDQERIQNEIARIEALSREKSGAALIETGYKRLAYGGIADAVRLIFSETLNEEELEAMDLFNVAEIKRPKAGGLEIKFYDRFKALEKLQQLLHDESGQTTFLTALEKGAMALNEAGKHDV